MKIKDKVIELRKEGKSYNEISKELNISKSTVCYHCKSSDMNDIGLGITPLSTDIIEELKEYYKTHTAKETAKKFSIGKTSVHKYTSNKMVKMTKEEKKKKNVNRVGDQRRKNKEKCVDYKGGKCERCGYNKCISALEFHHLYPDEKDFTLSGSIKSWEITKKELDKCIIVCANCHREIHYEIEQEKMKNM